MGEADAAAAVARARDAVGSAVHTLSEASARTETLAEFVPSRRVIGIPRAPRMRVIGPVWRLGVLLLDADRHVYGTGRVIRAERAARKSVTAESVAVQRAYREAAVRGGIAEGATVVFDAEPVELDAEALAADATSGPLVLTTGPDGSVEVGVRWNPSRDDALIPFASYLAERVDLLVNPPQGA